MMKRGVLVVIAVSSLLILMSCGQANESPSPTLSGSEVSESSSGSPETATGESQTPLAGTQWRLVEIQSMDDTVGTVQPDDPSLYTMLLNRDGTVNMRLNCNRANGSWSAEPSAEGSSGRFEFGPLAMTRALCPPGSLDERIAAQAEYVRSYLLENGRLYLSLMADGGIIAWEPDEGRVQTETDAALEEAILRASPDYKREIVGIDGQTARYVYSRIDLNEDGEDEVFVYMLGSIFCGSGGCNLLLFTLTDDGYSLINDFPLSREPVIVSPERTEGWHDLIRPESGGGAPLSFVKHTFDGQHYVEGERMPGDVNPEGARILTGGFTFEDGIPLEPQR